jgi:poly(3-hydroxybutyrate) depolymerase
MYVFRFPVAGVPCTWGVYVPRRFNPEGGLPLGAVVVLHDTGSNGKDFLALGKWRLARSSACSVIIAPDAAPDASGKPEPSRSRTPHEHRRPRQAQRDAREADLRASNPRKRGPEQALHVVGHGTGGRMAAILGFELAGLVAGVGSVGGPISVDAKLPHPVALALVHGRKDTVYPLSGGKTPVEPLWRDWAGQLGCSTKIATFPGIPGLLAQSANDCVSGSEAALFVVDDTGHSWPTTFDAASTLLDLFLRRPLLPKAPHKGVVTFK